MVVSKHGILVYIKVDKQIGSGDFDSRCRGANLQEEPTKSVGQTYIILPRREEKKLNKK